MIKSKLVECVIRKKSPPELVTPCCSFPQSRNNHISSRTRSRLLDNCQEKTEGVPGTIKRRKRKAGRIKDETEVMAHSPEMVKPTESLMHKAKEWVEATTTTPVPPSAEQSNHTVHVKPEPSDDQELVDFRGLAMVPRCHASLLERACVSHPDLAVCPNRSSRWREFAYWTLGELLFLLTSMRRREMTQKGMEELQILWEEAQGLGFDLSWLALAMKSVQGASSVLETISQLQTRKEGLKDRRDTLHCQLTTLTMQLIEVDKELAAVDKIIHHGNQRLDRFLYTGL